MSEERCPVSDRMSEDLYSRVGGWTTCQLLAQELYREIEREPILKPLFPGKSHRCAIEQFSAFLCQLFGGTSTEVQRRHWISLRESHARFRIGQGERDSWLRRITYAISTLSIEPVHKGELKTFFEEASKYLVNDPSTPRFEPSLAGGWKRRWELQHELDELVSAIQDGECATAISIAQARSFRNYLREGGGLWVGVLMRMVSSREQRLMDFVRSEVVNNPQLVHDMYGGRTLLHASAGVGDASLIELLLRHGADPGIRDYGAHPPLYCLANECRTGGGSVVQILVRAGANVNSQDGVQGCSPLHMAARRDNSTVAEALLECGANIESHDRQGDTPLRRAVNCNSTGVADLLVIRGADVNAVGSKRLTPMEAARTEKMKRILSKDLSDGSSKSHFPKL